MEIYIGCFFLLIATVILRVQCTDSFADAGSRKSVLRIRDVYPRSDFFPSRIPDPNCLHPRSRVRIKEFKYFNPQKNKKWFLSSRKYDPGCLSRIPDPDADFLPIPDPRSRGQKGTGSRIRIRNTEFYFEKLLIVKLESS
jgi:hypothetical protein